MINKKILGICFVLLLFVIIPSSFALNDENITGNDDFSPLKDSSFEDNSLSNDYYFDASRDVDGNGSQSSPYKELTSDRLIDNSVIHLADGEYELDRGKAIKCLSIIGNNNQNTVVKFKNNNSVLTVYETLTLHNLTLVDVSIINVGTLEATNVTFRDSVGYFRFSQSTNMVNSASNSFGGAIYCPEYDTTAYVSLDNCTFINNTAEYGGAIYMHGGRIDIKNSLFFDNFAYNYGGAIACEYNSRITISNSKFVNSKSLKDAGGALYLKTSKLNSNTVEIHNSQATFGSGITSLNSDIQLIKFRFINNTAKYEGGAIYQFYGSFSLRNSHFINNSAKNGGALFLDNTTSNTIYNSKFTNNSALEYGGAVYSLLNLKNKLDFNEYLNNTAEVGDDYYQTDSISIVIGNGNYSMYKYNSTDFTSFPDRYNALDWGLVTSVKDQQSGGNCWAFAGLAVLESCILKASGDNLDLSEENMKNLMELYSDYGWFRDTNSGGYPSMIMGYLVSWIGPVFESSDENDDYSVLSPLLDSIMHVQNIMYIKRSSYLDNDAIKEAILKYGAVGTGIYFDYGYLNENTSAYFSAITSSTNHAVTIVGWDDNYSADNFITKPRGNGAFIVKNSWGDDWGDNGYFYVSYYDTSFARIGETESIYTFVLNDTVKYDKNYQYDIIGKTDYLLTGSDNVWYQNIFNATGSEFLAAVSTYFEKDCEWNLSVYVNDALKLVKNGIAECGYYTIDLGDYISLEAGDIFKIIFRITSKDASFPICEKVSSTKVLYKPNISFFSLDGENWIDLYDYKGSYSSHTYSSQVACIKAFTFSDMIRSDLTLNISDKDYNPITIVANVINQYGSPVCGGNVLFTVGDDEYNVSVVNGIAELTLDLEEMQTTQIDAKFNGVGLFPSQANSSITINKRTAKVDLIVTQHSTTTTINIVVSKSINETFIISVNDTNYTVKTLNGTATLVFDNLNGEYLIKAGILNDAYANTTTTINYTVSVKPTMIVADDLIGYHNGMKTYSVTLADESGNGIANREVIFTISDNVVKGMTNENGIALFNISLKEGSYKLNIYFDGDENYIGCEKTVNVNVKSLIDSNNDIKMYYNSGAKYKVRILANDGKHAGSNEIVTIKVAGNVYKVKTDKNGYAYFKINLKPKTYRITAEYKGCKVSNKIIVKNILITKDISAKSKKVTFKAKLLNSKGKPFKGKKITFKIKGKTYKIKTNKKGIAKLVLKKLKVGKYTIKATYAKLTVKNIIKVKK